MWERLPTGQGRGQKGEVVSKACVLSPKVATTFVSRRRDERRWHVDRIFTLKKNVQRDPVTGPGGLRGLRRPTSEISVRHFLPSQDIWKMHLRVEML